MSGLSDENAKIIYLRHVLDSALPLSVEDVADGDAGSARTANADSCSAPARNAE